MAGFAGRCKHRPLRMQGKVLPNFTGYPRREPAIHPSVCALRRIQRPVCGARIALRVLKHTRVLRPLRYREAVKTGAVSEGWSYAFYRRTGDNKRSDGRLPHEKQLSPLQAALDSAAPCRGAFPNGSHPQSRQNKYSPEHGGSGLYCFVPRPRSGGPYSEITEANGRRDKPAHGGKPGTEAPHAASPNCAGGPLR